MATGDGFMLGVDLGTSNTVATLRRPDGSVTPLLFDGTPVLPSAVFAGSDGTLSTGQDALHHGRHRPDALEPNPKRRVDEGTVLLGAAECSVVALIGAVLARVRTEAVRVAGREPAALVLAHPSGWGPVRRLVLADAAREAGLPAPTFVPEPVAAALYFGANRSGGLPVGAHLLVYDLGAGTFDVTVLRVGDRLEVLGNDGVDVGGLDVDEAVVAWLRPHYDEATWNRLAEPRTAADRQHRRELRLESRVAKEMLSRTAATLIRPPLLDAEVPLTLAEFEQLVRPLVDRTVRTAQGLARHCGVTPAQVLLVGGSSRIPLVATALHRAFGVAPTITEQPETVVAQGCGYAVAEVPFSVWTVPTMPVPAQRTGPPGDTGTMPVTRTDRGPVDPDGATLAAAQSNQRPNQRPNQPPGGPPAAVGRAAGGQAVAPARPARVAHAAPPLRNAPTSPARVPAPRPAGPVPGPTRPGRPARSRWRLWLGATLVLAALGGAGFAYFTVERPGRTTGGRTPSTAPTPGPAFPTWVPQYTDALAAQRNWSSAVDPRPAVQGECVFTNGRLEVGMRKAGIFRCPGPVDRLTDFSLRVSVYLIDGKGCAGIWFRRGPHEDGGDSGNILKICRTELVIGQHHYVESGKITESDRFQIPKSDPGAKITIGLWMQGTEINIYRNEKFVGRHEDATYPFGRIALGVAVDLNAGSGLVGFSDLELSTPPGVAGPGASHSPASGPASASPSRSR